MDLDEFIVTTYCLVDDLFEGVLLGLRLRSRGPKPLMDDREVITIEVVGEFLGLDTEKGIFSFFCDHYAEWFPRLARLHRTTFTRQAANLWKVKKLMWEALVEKIHHDPAISLVDSFCVPVCSFAKAPRHRSFAEVASHGYDAMKRGHFYGLEGHLRVCWPGVIAGATLAPAGVHDRWVAEYDLLGGVREGSVVVGDTNYWSPTLGQALRGYEVSLLAPKKEPRKRHRHPWPGWLTNTRRRIETVISQLVERYHAKRVRARDLWHLSSRWWRKILSHTVAVHLCQEAGLRSSLRFSELLSN